MEFVDIMNESTDQSELDSIGISYCYCRTWGVRLAAVRVVSMGGRRSATLHRPPLSRMSPLNTGTTHHARLDTRGSPAQLHCSSNTAPKVALGARLQGSFLKFGT